MDKRSGSRSIRTNPFGKLPNLGMGGVTTTPALAMIPCKFDLDLHERKTYWNGSGNNVCGKFNADLPRWHAVRPAKQRETTFRSQAATSPIYHTILLAPYS